MKPDKSTKVDKKKTLALEVTKQMSAGKYGQASKVLKELLALDPTDLKFRRLSATLNLKLGNRMTAKSLFESLVQEALDSQDRRLAESLLREYLEAGPRYVPFRELLGRVCEENGNNRAATVEYGKALEILIEDQETEDSNRLSELYSKIKRLSPDNPLIAKFKPVFDAPLSSAAPQPRVSPSEGHPELEIELKADALSEPETTPPSKPAAEPKTGSEEKAGTGKAPAEKSIVSSVMSFFKSAPTEPEPPKPPAKPETAPPEQSTPQTLDVTPTALDSTAAHQESSVSEPAWSQETPPDSASVQAEQSEPGSSLEAVETPQEAVAAEATGLSDLAPTEEKAAERASEPDAVSEDKGPKPSLGLRLKDDASQPPAKPPEPAPVEPSSSSFQFKFQSGQAEPDAKVDRSADVKEPQSEAVTPPSSLRWADAATESRAGAPLPDDGKEAMLSAGPGESTPPPGVDDVPIDQLEAAIEKNSGLDATSPTDSMQEQASGVEELVPTGEAPAFGFTPTETFTQEGATGTQDQEQQQRDFGSSIEQPLAAPSYDAIPITEVEQQVEELAPHLQQEPAPTAESFTPFSAFGTESDTSFQPPSEEPAFSDSSSAPSAETSFSGLGDLEEIQHQEQVSQEFSEDSKPLTLQNGMAAGFGTSPYTESPDVSAPPWYQPEPEPYERPKRRTARSHADQSGVRGQGRTAAHGWLAQSGKRLLAKLKRMVRVVITIAVATTLLPLGVAALVWIGLNEQPNSTFQNLSRAPSRTIGDPQKNGYFILYGLGASSGLSAATVGYAQWDATKDIDQPRCFEGESTSTQPLRFGRDVYPVAGWIRSNDPIGKFRERAQSIQRWSRGHAVLLSRYRQWLRMPFEDWGYGHRASPNCPEILHAHRLYVADGFARGLSNGATRLANDLRKWRGLLSQARTLSLKRMASIAFNEDLLVLSSLLTRTDANSRTIKPLLRFAESLKPAESSLRWAMQSELAVEAERAKSNRTLHIASEPSSIVRVLERMPLPRQRLLNDYADYDHALLKVAENPMAERPKLYEFTRAPAKGIFDYILNPIDNFMSRPPKVDWDRRVVEFAEIEARVRLISLQAKLRGAAPSTYAGRIAKAGRQYYDPFTGFSMVYNPSKSRLYSVGSDVKDDDGDPDLDVTVRLVPHGP